MDQTNSITIQEKRKRGKHLIQEERGMIQVLHSQGLTLRAIAEYVGCAHTTVYYELCRGTPVKKSARGRQPVYTAKRGQAAYEEHRKNCRRPLKLATTVAEAFIQELSTPSGMSPPLLMSSSAGLSWSLAMRLIRYYAPRASTTCYIAASYHYRL